MIQLDSGIRLCARFTLIRPLGRGGMGEVWLARDDQLEQEVVTKVVPADAPTATIELLRQECRNARRLSHPCIVRVFDFHQCDGVSFITMEHVEGSSVEVLREGSIAKIVGTLMQLADALHHAHQAGVVHRDVKASNVLLDGHGHPRLMDFGIAGILRPGEGDLILSGGGSRFSMSPQQLAGDPPHSADDVYGLGALAYHLVTGQPPFWPDAGEERIRSEAPEPIDPAGGVPPRLETLIGSMLAKSRAERPADMERVRQALEEITVEPSVDETRAPDIRAPEVRLTPPPKIEVSRRRAARAPEDRSRSRSRLWMTVAVFALLGALVVGVFILLPGWVQKRGQRRAAAAAESISTTDPAQIGSDGELPVSTSPAEPEGSSDRESRPEPPATTTRRERPERQVIEPTPSSPAPGEPQATRLESAARSVPRSDEEFRRAMSEGLAALAAGDSAKAKRAFQQALSVSPGSSEAMDGLNRAEESLRLATMTEARVRASELEQREDWQAALQEYEAVLALDPTIRFAQEGKATAEVRSELAAQLNAHIAHPERLANDEVLGSARQLLSQASSIEHPGPVLRDQMKRLSERIAVASTPIRVELISDNLTEVTVYRVGRLGRFTQHSLDLRPGTYTVVGSRAGFRDVRRRLTVSPNRSSKPLVVRCEERI